MDRGTAEIRVREGQILPCERRQKHHGTPLFVDLHAFPPVGGQFRDKYLLISKPLVEELDRQPSDARPGILVSLHTRLFTPLVPHPRKTQLATLLALCALTTGALALAPAGAPALTSTGTSNQCYLLPGSKTQGLTASGRACTKIEGGSAPGATGGPIRGNEVIPVFGKAPGEPFNAGCTGLSCLPGSRGTGLDLAPERPRGLGGRGSGGAAGKGAKEKAKPKRPSEKLDMSSAECQDLRRKMEAGLLTDPYPSLIESGQQDLAQVRLRWTGRARRLELLEATAAAARTELNELSRDRSANRAKIASLKADHRRIGKEMTSLLGSMRADGRQSAALQDLLAGLERAHAALEACIRPAGPDLASR